MERSKLIRRLCAVSLALGVLVVPGSAAANWMVFGSTGGPAADPLGAPADMAIAADGTIWVVSSSHDGVVRLDANGTYVGLIGARTGPAPLDDPGGIDVAADGTLYVTDSSSRVFQLTTSGAIVRTMGVVGSGPGELRDPGGLAVAADGSVWVADTGNDRIVRFASNGSFMAAYGSTGTALGQFDGPIDVEVASGGAIWIADSGNDRIQEMTALGSFVREIGTSGTDPGEFDEPSRISTTGTEILVADRRNSRVQRISTTGVVTAVVGSAGVGDGMMMQAAAVGAASDGSIWVGDRFGRRLVHFDAAGTHLGATVSGRGWGPAPAITSLERATDDSWLAVDSGQHQIVRVDHDDRVLWSYGVEGSGADELASPAAATIAADGSVYVVDAGNHRIVHVASDGSRSLRTFGSQGVGPGQMLGPCGVATAADTTVLVIDCAANNVLRFSADGIFIDRLLSPGLTFGRLSGPTDVDVAPDGHVWISESGTERVQRFTQALVSIGAVNVDGMNTARLLDVASVDAAADGTLLVAAPTEGRVVRFSAKDVVLEAIGGVSVPFVPEDAIALGSDILVANSASGLVERWRRDVTAPAARAMVTYAAGQATITLVPVASDSPLAYSFDGGRTFGAHPVTTLAVHGSDGVVRTVVREVSGSSRALDVPLDMTPPSLVLAGTNVPRLVGRRSRHVRVRAADSDAGVAKVRATFRGRSVDMGGRSLDLSKLPQGRGTIVVTAVDHAGNSSRLRWKLIVDRTAPRLAWKPNRFILNTTTTLTYRDALSGPARARVTVRLRRPGRQTVNVTLRDRAGNVATRRVTLTRRLSLSRPENNVAIVVRGADGRLFTPGGTPIRDVFRFVGGSTYYGWSRETRPLVMEVQWRLQLFGFYPCDRKRTGVLDFTTYKAVQRYQRARGIPAIATVGPQTRRALDAELQRHRIGVRGRCGIRT